MSKKQVFAAMALIAIAITTIAYAQQITGNVTVNTQEAVHVKSITDTFPARSAGAREYPNRIGLHLTKDNGFKAGDDVLVRVELLVTDAQIYAGFRSLIVQIKRPDGGVHAVVATLTPNEPYAEFTLKNITPGTYNYDVKIIYVTGNKAITHATFKIKATIVTVLP